MHLVEGTKQNMKGCYLNFKKKDNMIFSHTLVFLFLVSISGMNYTAMGLNIWNYIYCIWVPLTISKQYPITKEKKMLTFSQKEC